MLQEFEKATGTVYYLSVPDTTPELTSKAASPAGSSGAR
jgi:hypothetical protein